MLEFGKRVKMLRNKRKWTQEELGEKINVTKVSISGYENGTRTPDMETLGKLADVLETSVDFLLGRDYWTNLDASDYVSSDERLRQFAKENYDLELTDDEIKYAIAFIKTNREMKNE